MFKVLKRENLKPLKWLEIIVAFTVLTLAVTYLIPGDSLFAVLRYVFGFVFVVFLPGYCLINILFMGKNSIDPVEQVGAVGGFEFWFRWVGRFVFGSFAYRHQLYFDNGFA